LGTFQILNTKAITIIDGTLIFPAYYGGALILSYLSSLLILKEKISNKQKLSLAVGVIAIVLMNL
jgi:multidrug transporter EmrE-like cation transporter